MLKRRSYPFDKILSERAGRRGERNRDIEAIEELGCTIDEAQIDNADADLGVFDTSEHFEYLRVDR